MSRWRCLAILAAIEVLAFRLFLPWTGLFGDDWCNLELSRAGGAGAMGFPFSLLARPSGDLGPWAGQSLLAGLALGEAWLLCRLLERLTRDRGLALAASSLALLFPGREGAHFWISCAPQAAAEVLVLGSMILHCDWVERGDKRSLGASLAAYLVSLIASERAALLPLLLAGALCARSRACGSTWRGALGLALRGLAPYGGPLLVILGWRSLALGAFAQAYRAGFDGMTTQPLRLIGASLGPAWLELSGLWLPSFALSAACAALLLRPEEETAAGSLAVLGAAAGATFLAAHFPLIRPGGPVSVAVGMASSASGAGAWAAGMFLAGGLFTLARLRALRSGSARRLPALLLAAAVWGFLWTDWWTARAWNSSWRIQREILDQVGPRVKDLPAQSVLLLKGAPTQPVRGVGVFDESRHFGCALRLWTGRRDVEGVLLSPRIRFSAGSAFEGPPEAPGKPYPIERLYLYDFPQGRLLKVLP